MCVGLVAPQHVGSSQTKGSLHWQAESYPLDHEGSPKDGFMKSAFRDMKESAKLQRQIDKANFQAVKLETKAFYEEQKRLSKPSARSAAERARMQRELEAANKRVEEAQAKVNSAKKL